MALLPRIPGTLSSTVAPPQRQQTIAYAANDDGSIASFFVPIHYERNYSYPLIVWLHGTGRSEQNLRKIMPLVSTRNYVAVAPRGTASAASAESRQAAYDWRQTVEHIDKAERRVFGAVEAAQARFNVASHRIFLAGSDEGGTMAVRLALRRPEQFAGVATFGGAFPRGRSPLSRLVDARRLPVFIACGRSATRYSDAAVCEDLRLLYSAGFQTTLRQYPCGDELFPAMLADFDRWIMERINDPASSAVACRPSST